MGCSRSRSFPCSVAWGRVLTTSNCGHLHMQMGGQSAAREIDKILSEVDADKDGKIDFSEFCQMMRQGNEALLQSANTMRGRRKAK